MLIFREHKLALAALPTVVLVAYSHVALTEMNFTCIPAPNVRLPSVPAPGRADPNDTPAAMCPAGLVPQPAARFAPKGMPAAGARNPAPAAVQGADYFYADAYQYATTTSISGDYTQHAPIVDSNDFHSLAEIAAQSADALQIVEIGWIVNVGDPDPQLFVYHWIDGNPTCYNGCGYVQVSATRVPGMYVSVTDVPQTYAIQYSGGNWYVGYQGEWIGYFPGTLWSGTYTEIGLAQWFGEIAAGSLAPCTQMGAGVFADQPGAASITGETIGNGAADALPGKITNEAYYSAANFTATGFNYGGPGACVSDVIFENGFDGP